MSKPKFLHIDSLSLQHIIDDQSELIPLMTPEDEEEIQREEVPESLPILPLRNTVLFTNDPLHSDKAPPWEAE